MKSTVIRILNMLVIGFTITLLWGCDKKLSKDEAERLISEKYKLPYSDIEIINIPKIMIWTYSFDWNNDYLSMPSSTLFDEIVKTGKYSNINDFNKPKSKEDWKRVYIAEGDFEKYKKFNDIGIIKFQSYNKGNTKGIDENGNKATSMYEVYVGNYWNCAFSLTPKANELGITNWPFTNELGIINWQYKAADWVFDDIQGIFNKEAEKTADVEYSIRTKNPTSTAKLFGNWTEKKQNLKASFKLYDDGWRIE